MNTNSAQLLELKNYIDDTFENLKMLEEKKNEMSDDDRNQFIMECYANIADLEQECRDFRREMRKKLKLTDSGYRKWRAEQDEYDNANATSED